MCAPPLASKVMLMTAAAVALVSGCATVNPAPPPWRRTPAAAQRSPLGSWTNVTLRNGAQISGEIIAADAEAVYLGAPPLLLTVPGRCVRSMQVAFVDAQIDGPAAWGVAGAISTLTHGFFLFLSAPVWLTATVVSTTVASGAGYRTLHFEHGGPIASAGTWARFPQGLPPRFAEAMQARQTLDQTCAWVPLAPPSPASTPAPVDAAAATAPAAPAQQVPGGGVTP